jgi:hypothetical protein
VGKGRKWRRKRGCRRNEARLALSTIAVSILCRNLWTREAMVGRRDCGGAGLSRPGQGGQHPARLYQRLEPVRRLVRRTFARPVAGAARGGGNLPCCARAGGQSRHHHWPPSGRDRVEAPAGGALRTGPSATTRMVIADTLAGIRREAQIRPSARKAAITAREWRR